MATHASKSMLLSQDSGLVCFLLILLCATMIFKDSPMYENQSAYYIPNNKTEKKKNKHDLFIGCKQRFDKVECSLKRKTLEIEEKPKPFK
jgi:hypothetical protein